jgi:hypothetical protein
VEQGENTVPVNLDDYALSPDVTGESGPIRYVPVVYTERTPTSSFYVLYLGYIENVPIGDLEMYARYNGTSPATVAYRKSAINGERITESITTAAKQTTITAREKTTSFYFGTTFQYHGFGGSLATDIGTNYEFNSTTKETSTQDTIETMNEYVEGHEGGVSYEIGYNGEPAGRYRIVLFATTDVYLTVQMKTDNSALIGDPEITVCARKPTITAKLDYDANLSDNFFPRTGGGGMLPIPDDFSSLKPLPGLPWFVAVGTNGKIAYSKNGIKWTTITTGETSWNSVAYGNGKFVAVGGDYPPDPYVGNQFTLDYTPSPNIARSDDGINWTTVLLRDTSGGSERTNWESVTYVNDRFVIAGSNYNWHQSAPNFGSARWVKESDLGRSSTNGTSWSSSNYGVLGPTSDFAYGSNNQWVTVNGSNRISYSTNFSSWTGVTNMGDGPFVSVAFGYFYNTPTFVMVGKAGSAAVYTGSATNPNNAWTWRKISFSNGDLNRVYYSDNGDNGARFVTVGSPTNYYTGTSTSIYYYATAGWQLANSSFATWEDVTYGNGVWVAVGGDPVNKIGKIATSPDGITWTDVTIDKDSYWKGVTFARLWE